MDSRISELNALLMADAYGGLPENFRRKSIERELCASELSDEGFLAEVLRRGYDLTPHVQTLSRVVQEIDEREERARQRARHVWDAMSDCDSDLSSVIRRELDGESIWYLLDIFDSAKARFASGKRHAENRALREDVFRWCDTHMQRFPSMDAAAQAVIEAKIVPIKSFRTARKYVGEWKKLRPPGRA